MAQDRAQAYLDTSCTERVVDVTIHILSDRKPRLIGLVHSIPLFFLISCHQPRILGYDPLGPVEIQDSQNGLDVIQALKGV